MSDLIKIVFREDTFSHISGSFFGVWVLFWLLNKRLTRDAAAICATVSVLWLAVVLECYQIHTHPEWFVWFDTIKDMVMNGIGITLAVLAIRRV